MKIFLIAFIFISLIGCRAKYIPIKDNYTKTDSTVITKRSVPVTVPGSVVAVDLDSLLSIWRAELSEGSPAIYIGEDPDLKTPTNTTKIIYRTDPKEQTRLTILYDSLTNQLVAYCQTLDKTYKVEIEERERTIREQRETIVQQKESFANQIKNTIRATIGGLLFLVMLGVAGWFIFRRTRA